MAEYYYNNPCYSAGVHIPNSVYERKQAPSGNAPRYTDSEDANRDSKLLKDMNGPTAIKTMGGVIFHSTDHHDMPLLCFAVEEPTEDEVTSADNWYRYLKRLELPGLMSYEGFCCVEKQVVFTFLYSGDDTVSLRYLLDNPKMKDRAPEILLHLVRFLDVYREEMKTRNKSVPGNTYIPLCCISLDTVFLTPKQDLRILPLRAYRNDFPRYFPNEAGKEYADVTTDLYTAVNLSVQLMSGCEEEGSNGNRMQENARLPFLRMCLAPYTSWRPTLKRVRDELEAALDVKEAVRKETPRPQKEAYRDPSGNIVRDDGRKSGDAEKFLVQDNPLREVADNVIGTVYNAFRGVMDHIREPIKDRTGTARMGSNDFNAGDDYDSDRPQKINPNVSNRRGGNRDGGGENQ